MIVDTHTHVVSADQARYPLHPSGVGTEWYVEAPESVDTMAALLDEAGVERAVLVQAFGAYGYDNRYVVDAAATDPDRFTAVVIVDVARDATAAARDLRALAAQGASGVRLFCIGAHWIGDPETAPAWEAAGDLGLLVVATVLSPQLPALGSMLTRFPDLPVALDHCGFPDLRGGSPYEGAADLFALAGHEQLRLKVSSHVLEQAGDPRDLVDRLAAVFGPERLMWGSDFPQTHDRPYRALVELGQHACSRLGAADQAAFLGGNALSLWPVR